MNSAPHNDRSKGFRSRILKNTVVGFVSKTANLLIALLLIPFMIGHLGDADYGLWILVGSVVAYGSLLDFGIASAITKYVAEYRALGKPADARQLIASALWLYSALGIGIMLLCIGIAPWVPGLFGLAENQHHTAKWLVILAGSGIGLSIPFAASTAALQGLQRFDITSLLGTARVILFAVGVIAVLLMDGGLLHIAAIQILSMILVQIPAIWWIYRLAPEYEFGFKGASLGKLKTLASFSWSLFVVNVGGQLQSRTDEIVIGARLPVGLITPYSLAMMLSRVPQMLAEQFISFILPIASDFHAENKREDLTLAFLIGTRLTLAIFLSIGVTLAVLSRPILEVWVGSAYAEHATLVWLLVAALLFDTAQWPAAMILQGMNRHRIFAFVSLATGISNVVLSLALIPYFGLMGVALGTLIPAAVEISLIVLPFTFHVLNVKPGRFFREALLPAMVPSVLMLAFLYVISMRIELISVVSLMIAGMTAVMIYTAVYLMLPINSVERKIFLDSTASLKKQMRKKLS